MSEGERPFVAADFTSDGGTVLFGKVVTSRDMPGDRMIILTDEAMIIPPFEPVVRPPRPSASERPRAGTSWRERRMFADRQRVHRRALRRWRREQARLNLLTSGGWHMPHAEVRPSAGSLSASGRLRHPS